jgi:hypothetical protein
MAVGMKTKARWAEYYSAIGRVMTIIDNALSPAKGATVWDYCPSLAMHDPAVAFTFFEDFIGISRDDATQNPTGWTLVGDTATGAFTLPASLVGGVANIASGAVDENETYFQLGSATHEPFLITDSSNKPLYFSTRVSPQNATEMGFFVGLAEAGAITGGNFMADATAILANAKDLIGFLIKPDAPTKIDFVWQKGGQAVQEIDSVATIDGSTYYKLEFWFDGSSTIRVYVDGVLNGTTVTTSGATFPTGEELSPVMGCKSTTAFARSFNIDWIKVVQVR